MSLRLVQYMAGGGRRVGCVADAETLVRLDGVHTVYALARRAIAAGETLAALVERHSGATRDDYAAVVAQGRLLPPLDHPDPAHCLVTGTGLSHLGSADARDAMHRKFAEGGEAALSDSMKMFRMGLEGGKPPAGRTGVQPEWFWKGDGSWVVPPGGALAMPEFAEDGGEEPEVCGLYVVGDDGQPFRVGWALGNEFSDHIMERGNYLWLAHSKLRQSSFGPELLLGELPGDVQGRSRILRGGKVLWEKPFATGEANMSHAVANLEHHHFKYASFRRPGDVHVHFLGTATVSFADKVELRAGDIFEISAPPFGRPLVNTLTRQAPLAGGGVRPL
ncbi:MAG: AraD1 family protein [Alphaproteobacteria bacterium]